MFQSDIPGGIMYHLSASDPYAADHPNLVHPNVWLAGSGSWTDAEPGSDD